MHGERCELMKEEEGIDEWMDGGWVTDQTVQKCIDTADYTQSITDRYETVIVTISPHMYGNDSMRTNYTHHTLLKYTIVVI